MIVTLKYNNLDLIDCVPYMYHVYDHCDSLTVNNTHYFIFFSDKLFLKIFTL